PEMAWLKPHMEGQSSWTVGVLIPRPAPGKEVAALLQLRSSLVGTELTLPEPLRKPAGEALATSVETPLPMGSGDILVNLGQRIAVRARSTNGQTGVRIALGSARVDEAAPAHGLVATGRAQALDAIDWIALMHGGEGDGLPLQRIDVVAQKLNLLGGAFADTRVVVVPASRGATAVQTEGESLEGALLIPAGEGATIAGRFDRFHWRASSGTGAGPATGTASTDSAGAAAPAPADPFNPAKIPPLAIDFTDLRVADAKLGSARLRTRPTGNGLHIDQLQTRADKQRIDVTGNWTGRGASANTRLDIRIGSEDFGALMGGFGMSNRLGGGEGTLQFDAGWAGSPASFNLATLVGSLVMDIRNGRLLEVEPGAGRVLGLLSLAQLPRRLMLDFRDFFSKGFAFNQAGGRVDFSGGMARTDQLTIDGPAAAIGIHGTANLRAQSFDQTIEVRPKAGNLLTVAGAIAGGPVGAAIGAAANAVLQKPLGQMASRTYRVTGPWKEPKVEVIGSEQSRASSVPDEPPPG
ncbi:MAG TPA: AsmA-like C-terminal region-containing protein, partial [Lysobacter sp.]